MAKKLPSQKLNPTSGALRRLEAEKLEYLRAANSSLMRQLSQARAKNAEIAESVYQAAREAASGLTLPPIAKPTQRQRGSSEKAIIVVSDVQLGKATATYNSEVTANRIRGYADKIVRLTAIQRSDHPVRDACIYLLGDIIEGELIFPAQPYMIDASLYKQVMLDGPRILGDFLRTILTVFDRVNVVCIAGNHGRISRFVNPTTNADRMLYRFLAELFAHEPRIAFRLPDIEGETNWHVVDYPVGPDHGFLLFHGDQIRGGFAGFPFYGFGKKLWGWRAGAIKHPFRYAICGHWHTPTRMTLNDVTAWVNGSVESGNAYAQENMAAQGSPTQLLLFAHPKHGITAEYWVSLEGAKS